jgi:acyl-coenzyme A synthetase/AMP-(fatty) acid ligase/acyl carrier protein
MLQIGSISFDAATFEIWGALLNGGRLILFPYNGIPDPKDFEHVIKKNKITTMLLTTSLFNAAVDIVPDALKGVRELLTGGEAASIEHIKKAVKLLPQTQIINAYGPTENSTLTTCYRIPKDLDENITSIPIGSPVSCTTVHILNEEQKPVPHGEIGELYTGGDGVALGYLNRPELTAERFIPDPFAKKGCLYKTGDLVRYLPNNQIEYMGRIDDQIKISGFRIEPGEIENVLRKNEAVANAAVLAFTDKTGSKYLVGYVTANNGYRIDTESLRNYLQENLAKFMVPRELIILDRMPINPNGKLDRHALPKPSIERSDPLENYVAPRSETETALAEIWCGVLGIGRVGIRNNFFDIGGTSVLSARLITRIRDRFNIDIPIIRVYHYPTIEAMANFISRGNQTGDYSEAKGRAEKQRAAFLKQKQKRRKRR